MLETVLTGRNLLSPVLAAASRDVAAFDANVAGANAKAAASAQASAASQQAAAGATTAASGRSAAAATTGAAVQGKAATDVAQANGRAAASATTSAATQSRAHASTAQSASVASRAQQAANNALASSNGMLGTSLTPLTAGLGAAALGLGYAAFRGMEFDAAMSEVQAASQATDADMGRLRETALTLGADTKYSGEEAAQGITEMAKAGVSTTDIINGGLKGALDLAAAGQMEVADAAEIGATALSVFNLEGDQMSHVADLLAAGAGKAQGSVHDMGMALNQSALVADQAGLSIEDTAGALAMFASNGLVGSDAGTSFKTMLQALTPNSLAASEAMDSIGFSAYDAQGNFVGLDAVAGQLKTGLAGLTEEQRASTLETIFGSDAVRAANVLYSEGSAGVQEWARNVNDAGYASEYAAKLQDNLKGDLEKLGGAFDAAMTSIGTGVQGPLRFLVQAFTSIIDVGADVIGFWNNLPGPVQTAVLAFGAFTALSGPFDRLFERVAVGITSTVTGMGMAAGSTSLLGTAAATARNAMSSLMAAAAPLVALTILTSAVSSVIEFSRAGDAARASISAFNDGLEDMGNTARESAVAGEIDNIRDKIVGYQQTLEDYESQGWADRNLWYIPFGDEKANVEEARQGIEDYGNQLKELEERNARTGETTDYLAERFRLSKTEVQELADKYEIDLGGAVNDTQGKFRQMYTEEYGTTPIDAANTLGVAVTSAKAQTEEAAKAQEEWIESLQGVAEGFIDPLNSYKALLDEKTEAEKASAQATADTRNEEIDKEIEAVKRRSDAEIAGVEGTTVAAEATREQMRGQRDATVESLEESKKSWEDFATGVDVSLTEVAASLEKQIANQENWRTNLGIVAGRAGIEVAQILAQMGAEGVELTAAMATGTEAEMQRTAAALIRESALGGSGAARELDYYMKIMAINGREGGKATAAGVAEELGIGVEEAARIAAGYGVKLAEGINPVMVGIGKPGLDIRSMQQRAGRGLQPYAEGGYTGEGDKYEPAGVVHRGEYVLTKERTAKLGVSNLENLERILPGYAAGGLVDLGREFQRRGARVAEHPAFPPLSMTGHGKNSLHYTGNAIDVNTRPGTSALEQRELAPLMELARARGFRTIFMSAGHYNHGHVDTGRGGSIGGGSIGAAVPQAIQLPRPPSTAPFQMPISTGADAAMQHMYDNAQAWVDANTAVLDPPSDNAGYTGGGVERWRGTVMQALGRVRQPEGHAGTTLRRMQQESGGNPRAINNWDINSKRGTPSKGLMQVIDPTFAANRDRGLPNDIWDPLANIVASMNYALKRYGSLPAAYDRKGGYDDGGLANGIGYLPKYTPAPERVLSPQQTAAFERWMDSPASMPGYGAPAAMPGYGGAGSGTAVALLDYKKLGEAVAAALPPMIGNVTFPPADKQTATEAISDLVHEIRVLGRGGKHAGGYR